MAARSLGLKGTAGILGYKRGRPPTPAIPGRQPPDPCNKLAPREAALILDSNKHTAECERLVAVVRELVADPARAIKTSSDTDEDKAEALDGMRRRKTAALKNSAE